MAHWSNRPGCVHRDRLWETPDPPVCIILHLATLRYLPRWPAGSIHVSNGNRIYLQWSQSVNLQNTSATLYQKGRPDIKREPCMFIGTRFKSRRQWNGHGPEITPIEQAVTEQAGGWLGRRVGRRAGGWGGELRPNEERCSAIIAVIEPDECPSNTSS